MHLHLYLHIHHSARQLSLFCHILWKSGWNSSRHTHTHTHRHTHLVMHTKCTWWRRITFSLFMFSELSWVELSWAELNAPFHILFSVELKHLAVSSISPPGSFTTVQPNTKLKITETGETGGTGGAKTNFTIYMLITPHETIQSNPFHSFVVSPVSTH